MYKLFFLFTVLVISVTTASALPGSGSEADPWRIESRADLKIFCNYWLD